MTTGSLLGVTDLVGHPKSVSRAREYVRVKLGDDHPALDDVTLLVSEVVTNAVVHSNSRDGGRVTLAIADCHDLIHVDVVDGGSDKTPTVQGDMFAEGGRGLMLVEMLAHRWDVYDDHAGRTVWFQVKYKRPHHDDVVTFPQQEEPNEPAERYESATQRTARHAARTVTGSVELDSQRRRAQHLLDQWELDREGLEQAASSLGVPPMTDQEATP
jgi:anti-sigma regulatory factor (Ser/Thr protein kinase)